MCIFQARIDSDPGSVFVFHMFLQPLRLELGDPFLPTKESFKDPRDADAERNKKNLPIQETPAMPVKINKGNAEGIRAILDFVCTQYIVEKFEKPGKTFFLFTRLLFSYYFRASLSHAIEYHMLGLLLIVNPC